MTLDSPNTIPTLLSSHYVIINYISVIYIILILFFFYNPGHNYNPLDENSTIPKKYNVRSIMHRTACTIVNGEQKFPPQFLNRICQKRTNTNGTVKNRIAKTAGLINFFQSVFKAFSTPRRRDSSAYSRTRKRDAIPRTQYETFKQKTHFSW